MSHPPSEHKRSAPERVAFAIVTVSDSRDRAHDASGDTIEKLAKEAGHAIARRALVRDERDAILAALREAQVDGVDAIVFTGGTGIAPRDVTIDAIAPRFAKALPGFGEIFRALSFTEIGSAAFVSRAEAGVAGGKLVFLLPGSPNACRLAMERLILPEVGHLVALLRR